MLYPHHTFSFRYHLRLQARLLHPSPPSLRTISQRLRGPGLQLTHPDQVNPVLHVPQLPQAIPNAGLIHSPAAEPFPMDKLQFVKWESSWLIILPYSTSWRPSKESPTPSIRWSATLPMGSVVLVYLVPRVCSNSYIWPHHNRPTGIHHLNR